MAVSSRWSRFLVTSVLAPSTAAPEVWAQPASPAGPQGNPGTAASSPPPSPSPSPPKPDAPDGAPGPGGAPSGLVPNGDEVVGKVQAFYDRTQSFQSEFQQEFWVKAYNQKKSSKGTVTFQKPGRMDWVYTEPKDNRVVSDGTMLKVYEAANRQMYEQPVNASQYPAALSFLTGQGKLADAFKFQVYGGERFGFPGGLVLLGTPTAESPAYKTVLFYVDAATFQVRRVMIIDGQGNRNRFDFANPRVNLTVSPGQFKFTPPAGTAIVRP